MSNLLGEIEKINEALSSKKEESKDVSQKPTSLEVDVAGVKLPAYFAIRKKVKTP